MLHENTFYHIMWGTHNTAYCGSQRTTFETHRDLPASASGVLELKAWTTMACLD